MARKKPAKLMLWEKLPDGTEKARMRGDAGPVLARAMRMIREGAMVCVRPAKIRQGRAKEE